MGDGRYYSSQQFLNIIFLTVMIIILLVVFMMYIYKLSIHKKVILVMGSFLLVSIFCRFISEIAYSELTLSASLLISKASLYLYILLLLGFTWTTEREQKSKLKNGLLKVLILIAILSLVLDMTNLTYILGLISYIVHSNEFLAYKVSSTLFSDVKKRMLDYVFIVSNHGDIIFKNDNVGTSNLFKDLQTIDVHEIQSLFMNKVRTRKAFSKEFIRLKLEEPVYLTYNQKEIIEKGKLAGYILTFVDLTDLVMMLDHLSDKQKETARINNELIKYKEIVYDKVKEEEINELLDQVADNQQKSMLVLKEKIESLDIEDKNFISQIEKVTSIAKMNLKDVRQEVTKYINYYE